MTQSRSNLRNPTLRNALVGENLTTSFHSKVGTIFCAHFRTKYPVSYLLGLRRAFDDLPSGYESIRALGGRGGNRLLSEWPP
eukprot:2143985-Pyramimonas_sp.AAC.1